MLSAHDQGREAEHATVAALLPEPKTVPDLLHEMPAGYDLERDEGLLQLRMAIGAYANPHYAHRGPARWFRQRPTCWGPAA
jgi:hypothetical protein